MAQDKKHMAKDKKRMASKESKKKVRDLEPRQNPKGGATSTTTTSEPGWRAPSPPF